MDMFNGVNALTAQNSRNGTVFLSIRNGLSVGSPLALFPGKSWLPYARGRQKSAEAVGRG